MDIKHIFEALMLICFGISWPVSIYKDLKVKDTTGKSVAFLVLILTGYLCGIAFKLLSDSGKWVLVVYLLNVLFVSIDLGLTLKYSKRRN